MNAPTRRVLYVDWARGLVIGLALFSHVMLGSGGWDAVRESSPTLYVIRVITRAAAPTFILLFGLSLELAYVKRWARDADGVRSRLLKRTWKCYRGLVLFAVAALIGGAMTPIATLKGVALIGPVLNGTILTFYVFAFVLAMALVPLRRRIGIIPTLALTLTWWPVAALLKPHVRVPQEFDFALSKLAGLGEASGPSALHSLPLVVAGMAIGAYIRNQGDRRARYTALLAASLAIGASAVVAAVNGPVATAQLYVQDYRAANHFAYYAIGGSLALGFLVACYLVERRTNLLRRDRPGAFGMKSLEAFVAGNVVINLFIAHLALDGIGEALAVSVAFVVAFWVAFRAWALPGRTGDWRRGSRDASPGTPQRVTQARRS